MTMEEFGILAKAIRAAYPKEKILSDKDAVGLWYKMLCDIPYPVAEAALQKHIATEKWSPTIAEIRDAARTIQAGDLPDWSEAWEKARKAVHKFGQAREAEALEWLDPLTREAVNRFGFKDLCMMDPEKVSSNKAQFRDMFNAIASRKAKEEQLPESLKYIGEETMQRLEERNKRPEGKHDYDFDEIDRMFLEAQRGA